MSRRSQLAGLVVAIRSPIHSLQPQQTQTKKMASSLSSLSTMLSQPHCAVRIKFPKQYSVRFLSSKLLEVQSTSSRRTSVSLGRSSTFSIKISRNFSQCHSRTSLTSKNQIPTLRDFIPKATQTVSSSDVQQE